MASFYNLKVKEVRKETADTVSVAFDITDDIKDQFSYEAGQYVTLKTTVNGEELRRSYSLCSSPTADSDFRIAVKKVDNGRVSGFINDSLKANDVIEVMPPAGNFKTDLNSTKNLVAFAAGSGITPIISILKTALKANSQNTFNLFYSNKTTNATIFNNELIDLANSYEGRFTFNNILTQENGINALLSGRIDKIKAESLLSTIDTNDNTEYFICGPEEMIMSISDLLKTKGVDTSRIHYELFTTPVKSAENNAPIATGDFTGVAKVKVIMDDEETEFELATDGDNILDASMDEGVDAPFSCKGAVCCTCKAKVVEGSAVMEMNYALSDEEVEEGYILTCQAHPTSSSITVDFDVV